MRLQRPSIARWATMSVVCACLATQLSGLAHLALVPHVACAEHGELVEAGPRHLVGFGRRTPHTQTARLAIEPHLEAVGHSHDHCIVSATRREPLRVARSVVALPASPLLNPSPVRAPVLPRPPTIALLDVAPKNSPPSV